MYFLFSFSSVFAVTIYDGQWVFTEGGGGEGVHLPATHFSHTFIKVSSKIFLTARNSDSLGPYNPMEFSHMIYNTYVTSKIQTTG